MNAIHGFMAGSLHTKPSKANVQGCVARWAGLMLRAEWMDGSHWWWAVSEIATGRELTSSNDDQREYTSGTEARFAAERIARTHVRKP